MGKSRFDFIRRHPLCPDCGYDLVATIDAGRNVCPECGGEFEEQELKRALLPEDWTLPRGLGRAATALLLRAAVCLIGWTAVLTGTLLASTWIATRLGGTWIIFIMLLALGIIFIAAGVLGRILARGMDEIAGITSPLICALITLFAWISIGAGTVIAGVLAPMRPSMTGSVILIGCVMALIVIVKTHHFEDY
jgi:hypothetical protein